MIYQGLYLPDEATEWDSYGEYLKSDAFRELKAARLEIDGHECHRCGGRGRLELHHVRYVKWGTEDVYRDVVILCHWCHLKQPHPHLD